MVFAVSPRASRGLGLQVEELLRSPGLRLLAAEHLDVALHPLALPELARFRRDRELGQAGLVRLDLGERFALGRLGALTQPRSPDLDGAPSGGAAVGIDGGGEDVVLHVRYQPPALGDQADLDRLRADRIRPRDRLGMVGRVRDFRLQLDQGVALVERLADEVVGQLDVELDMPLGVGLALPGLKVLEGHVERAGRHFDLAAGHRLAEEVIDLQVGVYRLLWQVVALVRLQLALELGQDVRLDGDGLVGLVIAENGSDVIVAGVDLVGELEIDRWRCRAPRSCATA